MFPKLSFSTLIFFQKSLKMNPSDFSLINEICYCSQSCINRATSGSSSKFHEINEDIERDQYQEAGIKFNNLPAYFKRCQADIIFQIRLRIASGLFKEDFYSDAQKFLSDTEFGDINKIVQTIAILLVHCNKFDEAIAKCEEARQILTIRYGPRPWILSPLILAKLYSFVNQVGEGRRREQLLDKILLFGFSYEIKKTPEDVKLLIKLSNFGFYPEVYHLLKSSFQSFKLNTEERNQACQAIEKVFLELIREQVFDDKRKQLLIERSHYLNKIQGLAADEFGRFMTLIEENNIQDALSCANNIECFDTKSPFHREEVREKVRARAEQLLKDPCLTFKLLDILQKWQLNSASSDPLLKAYDFNLELNLLEILVEGGYFCEFWELLTQIQSRVIPQNFNYKIMNPFNVEACEVKKLRKESCQKILKKGSEILELPLPEEFKRRMESEISVFQRFIEDLSEQEEFLRRSVDDVLSEPLQGLAARVQVAEEKFKMQETILQQLSRENEELRTRVGESQARLQGRCDSLHSNVQEIQERNQRSETEMAPLKERCQRLENKIQENELLRQNLQHQYQEREHQWEKRFNELQGKLQKSEQRLEGLETFIHTFMDDQAAKREDLDQKLGEFSVSIHQHSRRIAESFVSERLELIKEQINNLKSLCDETKGEIKTQSELTLLKVERNIRLLENSAKMNRVEIEKIINQQDHELRQLLTEFKQNLKEHQSQDSFFKRPKYRSQEEAKVQIRKPKENDTDQNRMLEFNQQEKEERSGHSFPTPQLEEFEEQRTDTKSETESIFNPKREQIISQPNFREDLSPIETISSAYTVLHSDLG